MNFVGLVGCVVCFCGLPRFTASLVLFVPRGSQKMAALNR